MPEQPDKTVNSKGFLQKAWDYVRGFGRRIIVHACALLCAGVVASSIGGSFVFLGTYLGLICLVARGTSKKIQWLLPAGLGLLQILFCLGLGLPIYQCIFWGGFQAFVQRVFAKRFDMGFEWVVAILLLPVSLDYLLAVPGVMYILASLASLAGAGALFWKLYKPRDRKETKTAKLKEDIKQDTAEEKPGDPFEDYRTSIAKIRVKQILLPKKLQSCVQSLAMSAEAIIVCMADDARDVDTGRRFLNRYLPAAHSVLDNYSRHAKDAANNPQVAKALSQSEDVIIRLEQAFAYEHKHLLRNDIDDFSAELNVLDTLLKMEGR